MPQPSDSFASARKEFISLWGQMAEHWGINRTMAQIHALLMVSPSPLTAEQIMEELHISRGNASMNLRELVNWGIVRRTGNPGDRRDYFSSEDDVWTIFFQIIRERKKRELDPLLNRLDGCLAQAQGAVAQPGDAAQPPDEQVEAYCRRVRQLRGFFQTVHRVLEALLGDQPAKLEQAVNQIDAMITHLNGP